MDNKRPSDIIVDNLTRNNKLFSIAMSVTNNKNNDTGELISEFYYTLTKINEESLKSVIENKKEVEFCDLIMKNLYFKKGSTFYNLKNKEIKSLDQKVSSSDKGPELKDILEGDVNNKGDIYFYEKAKNYFFDILKNKRKKDGDIWYNTVLFELKYLKGMTYQQISDHTSNNDLKPIPISTIYSAVNKAIEIIRSHLRVKGIDTKEKLKEEIMGKYQ